MQRIQFSRRSGRYNYEGELKYLRSLPQTQDVIRQRIDLMYELALRDVPYFAGFCKSRESSQSGSSGYSNHFDPNQPRAPAGSPGGGQWVSGNGSLLHDAQYAPAIPRVPGPLGAAAAAALGIAKTIELYNELSRVHEKYPLSTEDERPIIEFYSRQYSPVSGERVFDLAYTNTLTKEETQQFCPRLGEVQTRLDRIDAGVKDANPYLSAQQHGTAVHVRLADEIKAQKNPHFLPEVSVLKGIFDMTYGSRGSIRIDVLEDVDTQTVCVYDIKTGKAGLSVTRSTEIAAEVYSAFKKVHQRVIVTEVRPNK